MSKNQVVKKYVDIFDDFVKTNFVRENNHYIFNNLIFKKLVYEDKITKFVESLKEYYYENKHFYLNRLPITYKQFNTLIRQICKRNEIKISTSVKYESSKYTTEYHIMME